MQGKSITFEELPVIIARHFNPDDMRALQSYDNKNIVIYVPSSKEYFAFELVDGRWQNVRE